MKMMAGALLLASWKRALTNFSPSPTNLDVREAAVTLNSDDWDSAASAFASSVFPLPD
jgi:hypothetical protein